LACFTAYKLVITLESFGDLLKATVYMDFLL
jgi:hypothetical protein